MMGFFYNTPTHSVTGLSLIEFITVIAIIGIFTVVATPYLGALIGRYQAESAGYHVLSTLKLCRVEAFKRENQVTCVINASNENKNVMSQIYIDTNNNNSFQAGTDKLLNKTTMSNTSFLRVFPPSSTFVYNRTGASNNDTTKELYFCAIASGTSLHLHTLVIQPFGVIYLKEAPYNAPCPAA